MESPVTVGSRCSTNLGNRRVAEQATHCLRDDRPLGGFVGPVSRGQAFPGLDLKFLERSPPTLYSRAMKLVTPPKADFCGQWASDDGPLAGTNMGEVLQEAGEYQEAKLTKVSLSTAGGGRPEHINSRAQQAGNLLYS